MNHEWIGKPIFCESKKIRSALDPSSLLLPNLKEIDYRMRLVMKSIEMIACEGRQLSYDDIDRMEYYEGELQKATLEEVELRDLVAEFEREYSRHLQNANIEVDHRALQQTSERN